MNEAQKEAQPANSTILCFASTTERSEPGMEKLAKSGKKLFHYVYNYIFSGIQVFDMVYVDVS